MTEKINVPSNLNPPCNFKVIFEHLFNQLYLY